MSETINSCPICGYELLPLDTVFDRIDFDAPPAMELTQADLDHARHLSDHQNHMHLIEEVRPGVYREV
jgi:hypothetical protein